MQTEPHKLRVAHPIETQPATFHQGGATEGATHNATASLKALARLALQGNKAQPKAQPASNSGQNQAQLEPAKTPAKVAPVAAAIPAIADLNSENSGHHSTDPVPTSEAAPATTWRPDTTLAGWWLEYTPAGELVSSSNYLPAATAALICPPLVRCADCAHFERDRIGDGNGVGSCKANAWRRGQRALWPTVTRHCDDWVSVC